MHSNDELRILAGTRIVLDYLRYNVHAGPSGITGTYLHRLLVNGSIRLNWYEAESVIMFLLLDRWIQCDPMGGNFRAIR